MRVQARRLDRSPQLVGLVRRARRVLPGDQGFGDPLSVAGDGGARAVARVAERVFPDSAGASREAGFAALQVWQAVREWSGRGEGDAEVTLVFTDLVAFSSWALGAGDEATLRLLRSVAGAVEPEIVARGGRVVKRMGDGLLADFRTPERALDAVVAARAALRHVDADGYRPVIRVGIHSGHPRRMGGDWLGVDVNIAARMMEAGRDGNVVVSEVVRDALDPQWLLDQGLRLKEHRRFFLNRARGVPDDLRMYRVEGA
ncbi:adenylate/guanylate cyclase domain-containing protein [Tomitella fengzijianii]|uniref:Adenylate/guanylate cyclase domain-containing protein n=1 Tax=Tomitella fengzijianii TaxID=2597660 RepID=A0A516X8K0_9ACTN|nr:adenylate/guanylate cyclase domain-containing protein [Tomitella fengzijianii]